MAALLYQPLGAGLMGLSQHGWASFTYSREKMRLTLHVKPILRCLAWLISPENKHLHICGKSGCPESGRTKVEGPVCPWARLEGTAHFTRVVDTASPPQCPWAHLGSANVKFWVKPHYHLISLKRQKRKSQLGVVGYGCPSSPQEAGAGGPLKAPD